MIEFIDVGKTYQNKVKALQDINLKIDKGEFVAVIGPSGAGKSTLLRCINRMHDISEGKLIVDGIEVNSLQGKEIRKFRQRIGMVFQSYNLVTRISVLRNVLVSFVPNLPYWRKMLGIFSKEQKIKGLSALDSVGILDKAYVRVDQLSGGQQQRVALARTLAQDPDIILADEPIASLDPVTARQVMDDFTRINQEMDISVIINIHHVEIALEYADRIIGIREGKVVYDGTAKDITQEDLNYIYKGQINELKQSEREETVHV